MRAPLSTLLLALLALPVRADDVADLLKAAKAKAAVGAGAPAGAVHDESVALDDKEAEFAGAAERTRRRILIAALPKVQDLIQAILSGSTGLTVDAYGLPKKLKSDASDELLATTKAAWRYLNVRPVDYNWLAKHKPAVYDGSGNMTAAAKKNPDREMLETLETAARLMQENLAKGLEKRKQPKPSDTDREAAASNWGSKIDLFPDFWIIGKPPYPSDQCPGIVLLHEYYHHLIVNPKEQASNKLQKVFHGEIMGSKTKFDSRSTDYALANAYSLTSFAVRVADGKPTECAANWKPQPGD